MIKFKKLLIFIISAVLFWNCEEIPSGIVEQENTSIIVKEINIPSEFQYTISNKSFEFSIMFEDSKIISDVDFTITANDEKIGSGKLVKNENDSFSGNYEFDETVVSGYYLLTIYVTDILGNSEKIVQHTFKLNENLIQYELIYFDAPSTFNYSDENNTLEFLANFVNSEDIDSVTYKIFDNLGKVVGLGKMIENEIEIGNFIGSYTFTQLKNSGSYKLILTVHDILGGSAEVKNHSIVFTVNVTNYAPILTNLSAPDTIVVESPKSVIPLSIDVSDENGLDDIEEVYFYVQRPDGVNSAKFVMYDDGDQQGHGDEIANDGKFSLLIEIRPENQKGRYKFEFNAIDLSNAVSDVYTHYMEVQ